MYTDKLTRHFFAILLVCLVIAAPNLIAGAQEQVPLNTLSLSEAAINQAIRENTQTGSNDLSIDLQTGQFVVNVSTVARNGSPTNLGLTMVPSVANGNIQLTATRLTINGLEINLNNNNPAINETTRAINGYFTTQIGNGVVQSVAVSEDRLQITWLGDDPNGGAVTIQDSLLSLTFSEASVNRMSWVTNPTGPNVSAIQVDLQPGQAVVDVSRTIEPTLVRYILVPTVVNGIVTWRIDAGVGFESGLAGSIASLWNAYFDGIYREGTLSNTVITDDAVTFTWDLNRADPSGNPIVTYHTTEAEINAALAHYTPPELSALTVDMQPGRVIINAVGSNSQWGDFTVSMSMVPMLANGDLTWQAESVTINDLSSDLSDFQPADVVTDMLAQGTNNLQRGYVMDFTLDGTSMSITVRY